MISLALGAVLYAFPKLIVIITINLVTRDNIPITVISNQIIANT
jgi:hypothetical protein